MGSWVQIGICDISDKKLVLYLDTSFYFRIFVTNKNYFQVHSNPKLQKQKKTVGGHDRQEANYVNIDRNTL